MTRAQVAELIGEESETEGTESVGLTRVSSIEDADSAAIVFAQDEAALAKALRSRAGLVLAGRAAERADPRVLRTSDPRYAFAQCGRALEPVPNGPSVHPAAVVHETASVGAGTRIGAGAVVERGVRIGKDCVIASRAVICADVEVGDRCVVQSGAVIGATGFGYARNTSTGAHLRTPQQGRTVLEDDVEIGANTTIDRGALGETRIGRGAKIDNLVHIAHNCVIGADVLIAAQVGIAGSTVVERGAVLAGQVGLGDHVRIGPGVVMGGQSGVYPGKSVAGPGEMFAGTPAEPVRDYLRSLARVRRLK